MEIRFCFLRISVGFLARQASGGLFKSEITNAAYETNTQDRAVAR